MHIQYDGKNGHPYSSIGGYLMKGLLAADKVSMGALKQWLRPIPSAPKLSCGRMRLTSSFEGPKRLKLWVRSVVI